LHQRGSLLSNANLIGSDRKATGAPVVATSDSPASSFFIGREVNGVTTSPDGRRAIFALQDHTLQVWELREEVLVHVLKGHRNWVNHVAHSPDGKHAASASADKSIKIWNAMAGQCELTLHGHMLSVAAVAYSDDALRLASGSWDKTVIIWEVERGAPMLTLHGHTDWVHSVAWAPGGWQLVSASSDHSVRVWNSAAGSVEQVLVGHLQTVTSLSFARAGVFLASGSLDQTVRVWNVQEGALAARMQQDSNGGSVHAVTFSQDSERIIAGCADRTVKVWNFRTGDQEAILNGHEDAVLGICLTPDGLHIVSCSKDKSARVWRMPALDQMHTSQAASAPAAWGALPQAPPALLGSAVTNFQELHDRLRTSEDRNHQLQRKLLEAQGEIEQKMQRIAAWDQKVGDQEKQLADYKQMVNNLTAEKEKLRSSFEEMRNELQQLPCGPAGEARGVTPNVANTKTNVASPALDLLSSPGPGYAGSPNTGQPHFRSGCSGSRCTSAFDTPSGRPDFTRGLPHLIASNGSEAYSRRLDDFATREAVQRLQASRGRSQTPDQRRMPPSMVAEGRRPLAQGMEPCARHQMRMNGARHAN
jgi:hypothetical protein